MKYNRKKQKKIYALIILLLVTIGYALLSTTLKINGIANIKSNTWNIHFENVQPNNNSTVTAEKPSITDNATKVSYEVELGLPGDYYEFTVDAVNDGSINGKITKVDHKVYLSTDLDNPLDSEDIPSYILSTIYYDGTTTAPKNGDILESGDSKTYRIRIEYDSNSTVLASSDVTYVIVDEITYTQTRDTNSNVPPAIQNKMNQIIADPDTYRNQEQSSTNKDIGLDEDGNVINLDMWVDSTTYSEEGLVLKAYEVGDVANTINLTGHPHVWNSEYEIYDDYTIFTPATSSANVVDGEVQTPIPAYIMFAGTNKFYPVTKIEYIFGNSSYVGSDSLTVMPHIPTTVEEIGSSTFLMQGFSTVVIPKNIKSIGNNAFYNTNLSNLSFEAGSKLETIDYWAFLNNRLSGDLVLPQTLKNIGYNAFTDNDLTSVTFPSTATYFDENESQPSFDSGVTINHQY